MNFISCFFSLYKDLKLQRMFTLESLFMSSERLIPVLKLCPITKGIIPLSGSKANFDESSWHLLEVGRKTIKVLSAGLHPPFFGSKQ